MKFVWNSVLAASTLTAPGVCLTRAQTHQIWMQHGGINWDHPIVTSPQATFTGLEVFSGLLPLHLSVTVGSIVITRGVMVSGQLTKSSLNNGVLFTIWRDNGGKFTANWISGVQRAFDEYIRTRGASLCMHDCLEKRTPDDHELIQRACDYAAHDPTHLPNATGMNAGMREDNIHLVLDKVCDIIGTKVVRRLSKREHNGVSEMIDAGSKGTKVNQCQLMAIVGQQFNHLCQRITKATPHGPLLAAATRHGMVTRSFAQGLRTIEFFNLMIATRKGLVDTAVNTSGAGYFQRRIGKGMEDITVHQDGVVRTERNQIVQEVFSDDGFSAESSRAFTITFLTLTEPEVLDRYRCHPSLETATPCLTPAALAQWKDQRRSNSWQVELSVILVVRKAVLACMHLTTGKINDQCVCPVDITHLLERARQHFPADRWDLTPTDVYTAMSELWCKMVKENTVQDTLRVRALWVDRCATIAIWKSGAMSRRGFQWFVQQLEYRFMRGKVDPHEAVGMIASQNSGEPMMQLTLNQFHFSGQFSHLVSGATQIREVVNAVQSPTEPWMTVFILPTHKPVDIGIRLVQICVSALVTGWRLEEQSHDRVRLISRMWKFPLPSTRVVITLDAAKCKELHISPLDIVNTMRHATIRRRGFENFDARFAWAAVQDNQPGWWISFAIESVRNVG